jgi:hypothetical protein
MAHLAPNPNAMAHAYPNPRAMTYVAPPPAAIKSAAHPHTPAIAFTAGTPQHPHQPGGATPGGVHNLAPTRNTASATVVAIDAGAPQYNNVNNHHNASNKTGPTVDPTSGGISVSATFGIVTGSLIACCIIVGPLICILCRMHDRAKARRRKRIAVNHTSIHNDASEYGLTEAMVLNELGRQGGGAGGGGGGAGLSLGLKPAPSSGWARCRDYLERQYGGTEMKALNKPGANGP